MKTLKGFTLLELVVAMAILAILIFIGFGAFSYVGAISKSQQIRAMTLENISSVLDQLTKEVRQSFTKYGTNTYFNGIEYPGLSETRDLNNIIKSTSPLPGSGEPYIFDASSEPIFSFFTEGDDGIYKISYSLGVPSGGGLNKRYWLDPSNQPCVISYSREKWIDSNNDWKVQENELTKIVDNQAVTEQIITNFTVIRPAWSDKVVQIVIEAATKDSFGKTIKIIRIAQITLRQ